MHNSVAIIPARLGSTRLPNKVLADICGKTLVQRVWEQVKKCQNIDQIFIATDSDLVKDAVCSFGGQVLMTSQDCENGTHRVASIAKDLDAKLIINVQGDEPLVSPEMIDSLVEQWMKKPVDLITPVFRIQTNEELFSPNIVKVARAADGRALYFSRSVIPYLRDYPEATWIERQAFWGHIGVYGYLKSALTAYASLPISPLQQSESLEQLRFLEAGYMFMTVETDYRSIAIDTAEDLETVRRMLCQS